MHPGLCPSCVSPKQGVSTEGKSLIGEKVERVLAQSCVCSSLKKVHVFSEDGLALGEKFAFALKFSG